jgi:hypothetical protein
MGYLKTKTNCAKESGRKELKFAAVNLTVKGSVRSPNDEASAIVMQGVLAAPDGMAAVEVPDERRVFAPEGTAPGTVRRQVLEQETAPSCSGPAVD